MLLSLIAGVALAGKPFDFFANGPYDPAVPNPEAILGYAIGQRHTVYRDQERVVLGIAEKAKKTVRVFDYGKSWEGRPLRVVAISNSANIDRLESIRAEIGKLARGEGDAAQIAKKNPAIVWINECIHGDETASFESAMPLIYNLAASSNPKLRKMLEDVVVIVNPVYNPDGHERYVVWSNSIAVGSADSNAYEARVPSISAGRQNHYRFDMNRDRISMSQAESRQEVREFLRWNPQVYVDQHGQTENYFFPPNPMSVNGNVDRTRLNQWADVFGRATAKAFDEQGWMYFVKDVFDLYYPGYLDSWATLSGAIGMTHETDGGRMLARTRSDGSRLTMRDGAEKHFRSALAVIEAAANRKADLLASYAKFKKDATTGASAGNFKRVVVSGSDKALARLQTQLDRHGIVSSISPRPWTQADAHDYWSGETGKREFPAGSLVIDIAQPQGALAKGLLEPETPFEPDFVKNQIAKEASAPKGETYPGPEGSEFYDLTGWSLPYAHGLAAWWCESAPKLPEGPYPTPRPRFAASAVGYAIPYDDEDAILAVAEVLGTGVRGILARKPIKVAGLDLAAGTFLFMAARNEDGYDAAIRAAAEKRQVRVIALSTAYPDGVDRFSPGSEVNETLREPNIAVVFGRPGESSGFGSVWYLLEQTFKLPFTPITAQALGGDLSKYSCIVVPGGSSVTPKLREWVQAGGSLVVLGSPGWALGGTGFVSLDSVAGAKSLPGTLFRANIDPRSFLSYGYPVKDGKVEIAVPIEGDSFFKARKEGGSVVTVADIDKPKLSGWVWPDDSEKAVRGSVWAQLVPVGSGHVTVFTQDPSERALWPGLHKLLLNAMILGARN